MKDFDDFLNIFKIHFLFNINPFKTSINLNYIQDPVHTTQSTHLPSVIKTSQLMLHREIIALFSEIHTEHINTLCGQNVEFLHVKRGGI
jgi:hypothetical protein